MLSLQMADQRAVIRKQTRVRCARVARGAAGAGRDRPGRAARSDHPHRHAAREGRRRQAPARADGAHARAARADRRTAAHRPRTSSAGCCTRRRSSSSSSRVRAKRSLARLVRTAGDRQKLNAVFDALEDESSGLDARQRELLARIPQDDSEGGNGCRTASGEGAAAAHRRQAQAPAASAADRSGARVVALRDGERFAIAFRHAHREGRAR